MSMVGSIFNLEKCFTHTSAGPVSAARRQRLERSLANGAHFSKNNLHGYAVWSVDGFGQSAPYCTCRVAMRDQEVRGGWKWWFQCVSSASFCVTLAGQNRGAIVNDARSHLISCTQIGWR